jgi:hypothetical protein
MIDLKKTLFQLMDVVYVFLIYLFKVTIGYSMSKRKGVVNKEIGCCLEHTRER